MKQYKRAILTPEQVCELEELGFNFTDQDMLAELTKYRQEFGHCDVPIDWEINPSLGAWVDSQRKVRLSSYSLFQLSNQTDDVLQLDISRHTKNKPKKDF